MKHLRIVCAAVLLLGGQYVLAEDAPASQPEADTSGLSIEAQLTIPSSYVFRGYVIEEDHVIFQPQIALSYETQIGGLTVTPYVSAWANLTDAPAPGEPEWFNELDFYLGVDIDLPHGFSLGLVYDYYNSPANFFDDVHEIGLTLKHDCALHPVAGIYRELKNEGNDENTYIELSITPGFDVPQIKALRLDFPVFVGLSPDKYYTDSDGGGSVFGFCSAGVAATYTLNEQWALLAGVDYIQMLADSTEASNHGEEHQILGRFGVKYSH